MCESQNFIQEFVKYSVNFQKAHFKSLVIEKRDDKKHLPGQVKRPLSGQAKAAADGGRAIDSLIERLRRDCDEAVQEKADAEIKLELSLEFVIESVFLAILDIESKVNYSRQIS